MNGFVRSRLTYRPSRRMRWRARIGEGQGTNRASLMVSQAIDLLDDVFPGLRLLGIRTKDSLVRIPGHDAVANTPRMAPRILGISHGRAEEVGLLRIRIGPCAVPAARPMIRGQGGCPVS